MNYDQAVNKLLCTKEKKMLMHYDITHKRVDLDSFYSI